MSVHYKFKAALDFSTVTFDGIHISVSDLKKEIIEQKRLGKNADFDLQIQNAQTKEVYQDESALIPKNTSVIVARIPIVEKKRSQGPPGPGGGGTGKERFAFQQRNHLASLPPSTVARSIDLMSMDATEEEKIKAMMSQSTADYDPSRYMKIRGANQHGRVPDNYRCFKCNNSGHWIKNCPMAGHDNPTQDVKKSTGIPRSFMVVVDSAEVPGALITPEGQFAVPAIDREAYLTKNKAQVEPVQKPKIPEDLICPLCQDLMTDALLIPCCANSYCDECIRSALLDSEDQECPGCHNKDTSPNELIPNRFLRSTVNGFKNQTGYSKPVKLQDKKSEKECPSKEAQAAAAERAAESRKLSMDELPEDLFPHSPRKIEPEINEPSDSTKDLYDFNDGSIPSPFEKQEDVSTPGSETRNEHRGTETRGNEMRYNEHERDRPYHGSGSQHQRDFHRPPPHFRGGPPPYGHQGMRPSGPPPSNIEPPPPGFGDILPPGEERSHMPPMRHSHQGPPPHMPGTRDGRQGPTGPGSGQGPSSHGQNHNMQGQGHGPPPSGHGQGPPMMHGPGPFNPMQPPPGYPSGPPPGNMHPRGPGPIHGPGGPPSGPYPPHQFPPPNFNRMPPPRSGDPMYQPQGGSYHMDDRHHRDDYPRGRPPPRRPFSRDQIPPPDGNRPGAIEDPLKEFERIMREKDRRKQQMTGVLKKRSKSRSISPARRSPSPYRKRSRSPSFPRSPSPKRKRIIPIKRRNSFSRSRSRTPPPPPVRRAPRSRSRSGSRPRNRSGSPHYTKRRSPRRAPPCSPSPPPPRHFKKEKEEFFEHHSSSRYDERERPPRYPGKHHTRDREGRETREYDNNSKYEEDYKYPQDRFENSAGSGKHDNHYGHSGGRYDYKSSRPYHGSSNSHRSSSGSVSGTVPTPLPSRDRERDKPLDNPSRRTYEFEPSLVPPGTEQPPPISLFELNIPPPNLEAYKENNLPVAAPLEKVSTPKGLEPDLRKIEVEKSGVDVDKEKKKEEHRRRKSSDEKKLKKEKKKHRKDKKKEEKKEKKRKKSKDGEAVESMLGEPVPLVVENADTGVLSIGSEKLMETKLTAPCDSTVKSPDRPIKDGFEQSISSTAVNDNKLLSIPLSLPLEFEENENAYISDRGVVMADLTKQSVCFDEFRKLDNPLSFETTGVVKELERFVPMPASKWDEFDESGETSISALADRDNSLTETEGRTSMNESKVPLEVLRRAENVIFDKPITVQTISVSVTEVDDGKLSSKSPTQVKKITLTDIGTLPEESKSSGRRRRESDGDGRHGSSKSTLVASAVFRKPVRDRLGSKVSEDEALQSRPKEEETRIHSRSRKSPPRELKLDGDRQREKDRGVIHRSRRSRSRSRSPHLRPRPLDRPRSAQRKERSRSPLTLRRERSRSPLLIQRRERSRSPLVVQRRERSRSPLRRDRERHADLRPVDRHTEPRPLLDRNLELRPTDRHAEARQIDRHIDTRTVDRHADTRPVDRHARRSRSRSREDQRAHRRGRSPLLSRPIRPKSPELPYSQRSYDRRPDSNSRNESSERAKRRHTGQNEREPSPPGVNERPLTSVNLKGDKSETKTRSSDKSHDGASGVAAAFTNDYAELRAGKTKQRINIKLSSTSKVERNSSSSSDEHDVDGTLITKDKAIKEDDTQTSPDPSALKKKKKAKRHKSASSSSSSSSSSDGKHKKKSKKNKKKKKKKKKSK